MLKLGKMHVKYRGVPSLYGSTVFLHESKKLTIIFTFKNLISVTRRFSKN